MKKILFIALGLFFSTSSLLCAQSLEDEVKMIQEAFGQDKKLIVQEVLKLSDAKAVAFWPVYEMYETERRTLARERFMIIDDYMKRYSTIGEMEADNLATRTLKNDEALAKLHSKYYKKFKKAVSALDAAKFLQLDTYIHNTIRNAIQQELPFIDEYK
ncbi:hypothetical protein DFQ04_1518 [Algoriphagus boseongensis]|uniref:Uncharacterized protein n=1 Tax=Algoriphagus boseongensis TaxID=1442587 RepID=A0A4R6TBS1_9BACT|nr:hypothetical protein [Algoriphagus boseongensis]TDQ19693.1 hypothetical protein DFQ04_1518 [Algoriphagus boseongensis]